MYRDGVSLSGGEGSKRVTPGAPLSHSMGSNVTSQMAIAPPQISSHHLAREVNFRWNLLPRYFIKIS